VYHFLFPNSDWSIKHESTEFINRGSEIGNPAERPTSTGYIDTKQDGKCEEAVSRCQSKAATTSEIKDTSKTTSEIRDAS